MLTPEVNNLKQVGYHPSAFIMGDDVANSALNFLERGWNGENFHEVTENLRSSDPYIDVYKRQPQGRTAPGTFWPCGRSARRSYRSGHSHGCFAAGRRG